MDRCSRCILPATVPGIQFDEKGVCNFCLTYKPHKVLGIEKLIHLLNSIKLKSKRYDCIVPVSGGRDSAFVLYQAVKVLGLEVLAISYDNEFQTQFAEQNVINACKKLDVGLIRKRSDAELAHKVVKNSLLFDGGSCSACTYGYKSAVYSAAQEHSIPLIIWGSSSVENTRRMQNVMYKQDPKHNSISTKVMRRLKRYSNFYSLRSKYYLHKLRNEIPVSGNPAWKVKNISVNPEEITEISLFDYIEWNREAVKETIINELDWKKPEDRISTWRADCYLHSFENWKFLNEYGCTKDAFGYCNMINAGQMNRDEAILREEEMITHLTKNAINDILQEKVGLQAHQSEKVMREYQF